MALGGVERAGGGCWPPVIKPLGRRGLDLLELPAVSEPPAVSVGVVIAEVVAGVDMARGVVGVRLLSDRRSDLAVATS